MKTLLKHILILAAAAAVFSCEGPSPTELIVDNNSDLDELEIEILSPDPALFDYKTGYDSTGILEPFVKYSALVTVSGSKTNFRNQIVHNAFHAAVFSDKTQPFFSPDSHLIGYRTMDIGKVRFDNRPARIVPRMMSYRFHGGQRDTMLGVMYVLEQRGQMGMHPFPYDSKINVEIEKTDGDNIAFDLPTPKEITGEVKLRGNKDSKNIAIELKWNYFNDGKIDIIFGGRKQDETGIFPLFRLRTRDDGLLIIPPSIIKSIPFDRFDILTVTFERNIKIPVQYLHSDNFIIAKSIHNIGFDVP